MNQDFWTGVSAVSSVVGTIVVLSAAVYAHYQLKEARDSRNVSLLASFHDKYHTEQMRRVRRRLLNGDFGPPEKFDPEQVPEQDAILIYQMIDLLQFIGVLVERRLVDFELVFGMFYWSPPRVWAYLEPYVMRSRAAGNPLACLHLEKLARRYSDKNPGGVLTP